MRPTVKWLRATREGAFSSAIAEVRGDHGLCNARQARFEKILDTWERQQKQYQKYLDSLGK